MRKFLTGFRCAVAAAALLGVMSARAAEAVEYRDSNGVIRSANCTLVTSSTSEFVNGGWYAVKGNVTRGSIRVVGNAHLILCDGANLTVDGGDKAGIELSWENALTIYGQSGGTGKLVANGGTESAGIGLSQFLNVKLGGYLTVNGGIVEATGNRTAAGIGGSNYFNVNGTQGPMQFYGGGCTVTINGGQVTATGGDPGGNFPAAGIGGAGYGEGCSVAIHGGTVIAKGGISSSSVLDNDPRKYGWGIGWGRYEDLHPEVKTLSLTIDGGSVQATTPDGYAKGYNGKTVYCVTVNCKGLQGLLKLSGNAYGANDLYADSTGNVYLWLLNGDHWFTLSDGTKGYFYHANVNGKPIAVSPTTYGLRVNGTDIGQCIGAGWAFDMGSKVLSLDDGIAYTLTGSATSEAPQVNVNANGATVVLDGVNLTANNKPAMVVKSGVNATLQMKGASKLSATGSASAMQVDGTLAVGLAANADRFASRIDVSSGGTTAVSGGGALTVSDGTFCAQASSAAIGVLGFNLGQNVVMKAGKGPETPDYKPSYTTDCRNHAYVLVAPALTVTVENIPNVKVVAVYLEGGSSDGGLPATTNASGSVYRVMKDEKVNIEYASTNEMYLVTGANPLKVTVTDIVKVGKGDLVVSAVQLLTDGSHYLESHGTEWIDTGYTPCPTTRIEAEFNPLAKKDDYSVFFGVAGSDSPADGILMRYLSDKRINGWFCNEDQQGGCSPSEFENTLVMAELKAGEMTLNEVKTPIPTKKSAAPCQDGIYIFCGNLNGAPSRHQAMRLYSFRIWEWNDAAGREELVRDLVPFKTEDGKICGLYDRREGEVKNRIYRNEATDGASFALGRDSGVRYRVWDEESQAMRLRVCSDPIPVTAETKSFENGKWYVVTNTVSCGTITVDGAAHLILCDGAKLSVAGGDLAAGVAVAKENSLAIYGQTLGTGELVATAGRDGAGIGGGDHVTGGAVTIHGGKVTANGSGGGKGFGGGSYAGGGTLTICGGTVEADGWNGQGLGGAVTIIGGSVRTKAYESQPKNTAGAQLYCVTVKCPGLSGESEEGRGLRIEGLAGYGVNDIRAINGEVYLWLPVGRHAFTVSDGKKTHSYFAVVNGRARSVTVNPLTAANVLVNGKDIFTETSGTGWAYDLSTQALTLTGGTDYVITGVSTGDLVRIEVTADANVVLSNATIGTTSGAVIKVKDGHTLHLSAGNGEDAAYLLGDGVNAITGGTTVVESGSVCLWTTNAIPVAGAFSINPENEIMCAGESEDALPYVDGYAPDDKTRIVLVAPRCRFAVPVVKDAEMTVSVRNPYAEPQGVAGTGKGGIDVMVYELMLGDTAYVRFKLKEDLVWIGNLDEQAFLIKDTYVEVARDRLPVAVGSGIKANYRVANVNPKTAAVSYESADVMALVFDSIADKPGAIGKSTYGYEEWYVVTGQVECASVCVTTGTVNLILAPGSSLTLRGDEGEPGLGVMSDARLNIYGCEGGIGSLVAYGGTYAAGIGGGGLWAVDDMPAADAGRITVNGGVVTAIGGDFGAGIGGGAFGKGAHLTVNGGTVFANCGFDAEDIGGGAYGDDGVTVVNGGSVMANSVEAKPVNAAETKLYRVYAVSEKFIPTNDVPLTVVGLNVYDALVDLNGYGTADVFADDDGALCFYLPNGHYEFTVDGWKCVADVQDGTASAEVGERVKEEGEGEGEGGGERKGEGEGEGEEGTYAEVLGIEVGETVKVTVRSKKDFAYYLVRVTFEDGKLVEDSTAGYGYAEDDTLTLEDENPPAGSGFYVVEEFEL